MHVEQPRAAARERVRERADRLGVAPFGHVRHGFERQHHAYSTSTPTPTNSATGREPSFTGGYRSIAALQAANAACRRCLDAGHSIQLPPVVHGVATQRAYLFGLAPGAVESQRGRPWQGRAGATLRRWLHLDEETFFASFYCASVTRCYPGKAASGRGDRAATGAERSICSGWTKDELRLLRPALIVTVGLVPARRVLGLRSLGDGIGKSYLRDGAIVVPLPHPSGASSWLHEPVNRARLGKALTHVRRELARLSLSS